MKTLIRIVVALLVVLVVAAGASYLLPGSYRVERSIEINALSPLVFSHIGNLRKWAEWTPWSEMDPQMVVTYSDPPVGKGSWQQWIGPEAGQGRLEITAYEPPSRVEYELHPGGFGARSLGEILIEPSDSGRGVRVTWSDAGDFGMNPIRRWFGLFFDRIIGGDFEKGLAKLKELSEPRGSASTPPPGAVAAPSAS
ncbi:MAG: SRPBCC family protein [Opitutaceae bacterium]